MYNSHALLNYYVVGYVDGRKWSGSCFSHCLDGMDVFFVHPRRQFDTFKDKKAQFSDLVLNRQVVVTIYIYGSVESISFQRFFSIFFKNMILCTTSWGNHLNVEKGLMAFLEDKFNL